MAAVGSYSVKCACIDKYKTLRTDCPNCRRPLLQMGLSTLFPDLKSEREVKSLFVQCPTACEWNGELRSLKDHIQKDCGNTLVPCPNGCNNGSTKLRRNNIDFHLHQKCPNRLLLCTNCWKDVEFRNAKNHELNECPKRQYTCPHCNEAGMYDERTTTHLEVCPKVKVECSKCLVKIFRCDKSRHLLVCPKEPVYSKYYNIGCKEKPLRKDIDTHEENAQLHLSLATEEVLRLKNEKNKLTFRMKKFESNKNDSKNIITPSFHTSRAGYKMCLRVDANGWGDSKGTHVAVYAYLMKGDNDDSLSWPFTGRVIIELLNQLEDDNHHRETTTFPADSVSSKRVVDRERGGKGLGRTKFISHANLDYNADNNTQYLKDDTLIFRVSAEALDYKPWLECTNCV